VIQNVRRLFAGASVGWAAALPIATLVASRQPASSAVYLFGFAVYVVGSFVCHQRPERSFYLWAHQMPVCARCAGIYAGAALAVLVLPLARRLLDGRSLGEGGQPSLACSPKGVALVACAPAIATLVYEWTTSVMPSNGIRAATGVWLGAGIALLVLVTPGTHRPTSREVNYRGV
jgi:uncharacterized membrane protein